METSQRDNITLLIIALVAFLLVGAGAYVYEQNKDKHPASETSPTALYTNNQYGFSFSLPTSWEGYSIVTDTWNGGTEKGPMISIRHPLWTAESPRQDIPIMIFTLQQWSDLQQDKFHIGAAPIGPSELGRNAKYVFALPARYNYAFPTGYEEVQTILAGNPLRAL